LCEAFNILIKGMTVIEINEKYFSLLLQIFQSLKNIFRFASSCGGRHADKNVAKIILEKQLPLLDGYIACNNIPNNH